VVEATKFKIQRPRVVHLINRGLSLNTYVSTHQALKYLATSKVVLQVLMIFKIVLCLILLLGATTQSRSWPFTGAQFQMQLW
jgi:hypothetical protein